VNLDSLVRAGVAAAAELTASLQVNVLHAAWIKTQSQGPEYTAFITRRALVEQKSSLLRSTTNEAVVSRAKITLLDPVPRNGADGRREPVDPRDKFVLPDGTTGPILAVNGLLDPVTGLPYLIEVYLG